MLARAMRSRAYGRRWPLWATAWAGILLLAGCVSTPSPQEVLGTGFRSPEQTLRTFLVALRADLIDLEYRCLGVDFRQANGIGSEAVYARARDEVFEREPLLSWLLDAEVEVLERREVGLSARSGGRLVELRVEVRTWLVDRELEILFEESAFYETHDAEGLLEDDFLSAWGEAVGREGDELVLRAPMPEGVSVDELVEFRAGKEWKIVGLAEVGEQP